MQVVTDAEDAVETVAILAAAVGIDEEGPETGETQIKAIQDIEKPGPWYLKGLEDCFRPESRIIFRKNPKLGDECREARAALKICLNSASSNLIEAQKAVTCFDHC
ncbi:Man1a1 [Symbiodinium pilosum]|uniref:Man1a1 protein n=1 Tax=Symbiodinium pilosum TaxID=2952 RepID=A0A812SU64_SYMPI|nr:Man1a1 [Symbiodinium pilosum]